jgi:hypothetical protein
MRCRSSGGWPSEGKIEWIRAPFEPSDLDGNFLVIAATDSPRGERCHVIKGAVERGILCNSVDDIPNCDFFFGSVVSRGRFADRNLHCRRKSRRCAAPAPRNRPTARKTSAPGFNNLGQLRREVLEAASAQRGPQISASIGIGWRERLRIASTDPSSTIPGFF